MDLKHPKMNEKFMRLRSLVDYENKILDLK